MTILQSIILGILQGVTEFLPISSSGHLILVPYLLGWDYQNVTFDVVLHLGTAAALIIYFWNDLIHFIKNKDLVIKIIIGSIPAIVIGFLLEDYFSNFFRAPIFVSIFLISGSLVILLAEKVGKKDKETLNYKQSFIVGLFQALALLPGFSRSGSSISGGLFLGLKRDMAAKFSFLLSLPIVLGAGFYELISQRDVLVWDATLIYGFFSSFISGLLVMSLLIKFLKTNSMKVFVIYRLILAFVIVLVVMF